MVKHYPEFDDPLMFLKKLHEKHNSHYKELTQKAVEKAVKTLYLVVTAIVDLIEKRVIVKEIPEWIILLIRSHKLEAKFILILEEYFENVQDLISKSETGTITTEQIKDAFIRLFNNYMVSGEVYDIFGNIMNHEPVLYQMILKDTKKNN